MLKRGILKLAVTLILLAGSAGGFAVTESGTAHAATVTASQAVAPAAVQAPVTAAHAVTPADAESPALTPQCNIIVHRLTNYSPVCGSALQKLLCFVGNQGNFLAPPIYVANGCIYRVWLYYGKNETGTPLCISPRSSTRELVFGWSSYRIVSNQNPC